jgi:ketosteroid isomerase-like protein
MIAVGIVLGAALSGCHQARKGRVVLSQKQTEDAKADLRSAGAAFKRGDIDAAVQFLDPRVEWIEPVEFPGGGSYHGIEGAKQYLTQSHAGAAPVISEPEQFITSGDRICRFVHAKVLPKVGNT